MTFLKKLLNRKEKPLRSYEEFWSWFQKHQASFFKVIKSDGDIEHDFFDRLSPKLDQLKEGFYFVTGMYDEQNVELIFTADGAIRNIVFVEELVRAAPAIKGWRFTALKPSLDIQDVNIEMSGYRFNRDNIRFYANEHPDYPDEIEITVVHNDLREDNRTTITNGVCLFLDNFLGELNFATSIDTLNIVGADEAQNDLVPIEKLKAYLVWREKEFIEKYEDVRRDTAHDKYSAFEARLNDGSPLIAIMNRDLLHWDNKASHPWIMTVEIKYGEAKTNGLPGEETYTLLNDIENDIIKQLKDSEGYLVIGRQTAQGIREIYFACKDFRWSSKVLYGIEQRYSSRVALSYDIFKDKYWQTFNRFMGQAVTS